MEWVNSPWATTMRISGILRRRRRVLASTAKGVDLNAAPNDPRQLVSMTENDARRAVLTFTRDQINSAWPDDPYNRNYFLNLWECETGQEVLESYPWNISLPVADLCNARCTFCNSWLRGKEFLTFDSLGIYSEVLPYARLIGIQGHGEPLANPDIGRILSAIAAMVDKRAQGYIITNGVFLSKHLPALLASRITVFNVSLNATTEETHDVVMGLGRGKFYPILETIREIIRIRDSERPELQVTISMVLTADNMKEAADFVQLGNDLRVNRIYLRTLMPTRDNIVEGLNYHLLPPILNPRFSEFAAEAKAAIEASVVSVESQAETWATDAVSPTLRQRIIASPPAYIPRNEAIKSQTIRAYYEKMGLRRTQNGTLGEKYEEVFDLVENPYRRSAPFSCRFVYHNLITTRLDFFINPCCYMTNVPGHHAVILGSQHPFMTYWNSEAFVSLRRRLRHGPLFQACAKCPMQG